MEISINNCPVAIQNIYNPSKGDFKVEITAKGFAIWRSSTGNDWYEFWNEYSLKGEEISQGYTHHGAASIHREHDTYPNYSDILQR